MSKANKTSKKSTYRLPCVYCNNKATFPSSELLKEHLLAKHKDNICSSRSSTVPPKRTVPEKKVQSTTSTNPSSSLTKARSSTSSITSYQSKATPSSTSASGSSSPYHSNNTPKSYLTNNHHQYPATASAATYYPSSPNIHQATTGGSDVYSSPASCRGSASTSTPIKHPSKSALVDTLSSSPSVLTTTKNNMFHHATSSNIHTRSLSTSSLVSKTDLDVVSGMQEKKMSRMEETLAVKEREIERLQNEVENLKMDFRNKEEEQSRVRQRWRKEAEDALRNLKTNYKDVLTQKRIIDKQLEESDLEKEKLRTKNVQLEKELADAQAISSSEKRQYQSLMKQDGSGVPAVSNTHSNKNGGGGMMVSTDAVKNLRKENLNLSELLTSRDNSLKEMTQSLKMATVCLGNEESKNKELTKQMDILQGKLVNGQNVSSQHEKQNVYDFAVKLQKSETAQTDLKKEIEDYAGKNEQLENNVRTLKQDKSRLMHKLQSADDALHNLSNKVTSSKSLNFLSSKSSGVFSQIDTQSFAKQSVEIGNSLDEILGILKQLPNRYQHHSETVQANNLTVELQRVNLQLVEEKANVCLLQKTLEDYHSADMDENDAIRERNQKTMELQKLRAKHQQCVRNENVRKQLSREKKTLQRKYSSLQQEFKILNALYESSATDLTHKDHLLSEVMSESKQLKQSSEMAVKELSQLQRTALEKEKLVEKYKRESCYLLEKQNAANETREEMKKRNEILEKKLNEMDSLAAIKNSLTDLQHDMLEIKTKASTTKKLNPAVPEHLDALTKRNQELTKKITSLESQVSTDRQELAYLQQVLKQKDVEIDDCQQQLHELKEQAYTNASQTEVQNSMNESKHETQVENLKLENEILQSRVLILEGIRQEMDILTAERDNVKQENLRLREEIVQRSENSGLVLVNNPLETSVSTDQHVEKILNLEQLDEDAKMQLKEMLSRPEFQSFLSEDVVRVNLMSSDESTGGDNNTNRHSLKDLSRESFEKEQTVRHIYQASSDTSTTGEATVSYEDVIQIYSPSSSDTMEETIDYNCSRTTSSTTNHATNEPGNSSSAEESTVMFNDKSLDDIFSESKLISKDIAAKQSDDVVNYKRVLSEFQNVISQMSAPTSQHHRNLEEKRNSSFNRQKRVTFSDHVVDFYEQGGVREDNQRTSLNPPASTVHSENSNSNATKPTDSRFFKSFFQEALKRTYPNLAKYEDDDLFNSIKDDVDSNDSDSMCHVSQGLNHHPAINHSQGYSLADQVKNIMPPFERQTADPSLEKLVHMVSNGSFKMADPDMLSKLFNSASGRSSHLSPLKEEETEDMSHHGGGETPAESFNVLNEFMQNVGNPESILEKYNFLLDTNMDDVGMDLTPTASTSGGADGCHTSSSASYNNNENLLDNMSHEDFHGYSFKPELSLGQHFEPPGGGGGHLHHQTPTGLRNTVSVNFLDASLKAEPYLFSSNVL